VTAVALTPLLLTLLALPQAEARVYPAPIVVDNEDELRELYADGTLDEDDFEVLVELLNQPIDLNRARRGELYDLPGVSRDLAAAIVADRKAHGPFGDRTDLLRVEGFDDGILSQVFPFVDAPPAQMQNNQLRGSVRLRSAFELQATEPIEDDHANKTHDVRQLGYGRVPNTYLSARVKYRKWLKAGFLGLAQDNISGVAYDPEGRNFYASWRSPQAEFGKLYLQAERLRWEAIAGSYTAGFGLGLTFDTTSRTHPHGFYPDLTASGTDKFSLSKGLFGVGGHLLDQPLGQTATVDLALFASSWTHDVYQYDIGVTGGERIDPLIDETDSPRIYVQNADGDYVKAGYMRLPNAYRESLAGANATARFLDSAEIGATAWFGHLDTTTIEGVEDPYELTLRSGFPTERSFGAVGLYGTYQLGLLELHAEGAHSFTGGQAYLVKGFLDLNAGELEASLRHYATDYDNPHARGLANADEYGGYRDRDEQGARVKAQLEPVDWLSVRLLGDVWERMSMGTWNAELYGRVEVRPHANWSVVGFADHKNRDLANNGRNREYGGDWGIDETADLGDVTYEEGSLSIIEGAGAKNYWGAQLRTDAIPRVQLTGLYKRSYTDAGYFYPDPEAYCDYWYQVGHYAWAKIRIDPFDSTALSLRAKYEDEDVYGDQGGRYVEGYLQLMQTLPHKVKIGLRGTINRDLEDPESPWEAPCASAGAPDLCGSCICDESSVQDDLSTELDTEGLVQLTVEWRF
jgi:hypothetical protein